MWLKGRLFCNVVVKSSSKRVAVFYNNSQLSKISSSAVVSVNTTTNHHHHYSTTSSLISAFVLNKRTSSSSIKVNSWCGCSHSSSCQTERQFSILHKSLLQSNKPDESLTSSSSSSPAAKGLPDNWGSKKKSRPQKPIKIVIEMATDEKVEEILAPLRAAVKEQVGSKSFTKNICWIL